MRPSVFFSGGHRHYPSHWPFWVKQWAGSAGSLTAHLKAHYGSVDVEVRAQGCGILRIQQANWLGMRHREQVRFRKVLLKTNHTPVVAAESWLAIDGPRCDWSFWSHLGNKSLGSELFSDASIVRYPVQFLKLPSNALWVQQLLGQALFCELKNKHQVQAWYLRKTKYLKRPCFTPLWVVELFLPTLNVSSLES